MVINSYKTHSKNPSSCIVLRLIVLIISCRKGGSPVAAKTIRRNEFVAEEEVPLFVYTSNQKPSLTKDSSTETDNRSSTSGNMRFTYERMI